MSLDVEKICEHECLKQRRGYTKSSGMDGGYLSRKCLVKQEQDRYRIVWQLARSKKEQKVRTCSPSQKLRVNMRSEGWVCVCMRVREETGKKDGSEGVEAVSKDG